MNKIFFIPILFLSIVMHGQPSDAIIAMNNHEAPSNHSDSTRKLFSNSESPDFSFIVNSNIKENTLEIKTNYSCEYKIRFIDYYGRSVKVYKSVLSNKTINIADLKESILIMNIMDERNNLLTSQVLNLKRHKH